MFFSCDEDLGLCDHLRHTIPTTMDKPVYLPHHTILVQLQTEVCKCLDTWLKQGIIHPSQSPYTLKVVIVHKKSGEICLCIDFHALKAVTVCDSFPLLRIKEALQAVKAAISQRNCSFSNLMFYSWVIHSPKMGFHPISKNSIR